MSNQNETGQALSDDLALEFIKKVGEDPHAVFDDLLVTARARASGEAFAALHPELKRCIKNGRAIVKWMEENGIPINVDGMQKAYAALKDVAGALEFEAGEPEGQQPGTQTTDIDLGKVPKTSRDAEFKAMSDVEFLRFCDRLSADAWKRLLREVPLVEARYNKLVTGPRVEAAIDPLRASYR
jgi:hypothetical protein